MQTTLAKLVWQCVSITVSFGVSFGLKKGLAVLLRIMPTNPFRLFTASISLSLSFGGKLFPERG